MFPDLLFPAADWPVSTADPVNRSHRLNQGRAGWWLGLPGTSGGRFIYDLIGLAPGFINSPGAASTFWTSAGARIGGVDTVNLYNAIATTANRIDIGDYPQFKITGTITIGCWARWTGAQVNTPLIAKWGAGNAYLLTTHGSSAGKLQWAVSAGGVTKIAASPLAYNDNLWHRLIGNYDGANVTLYVDGFQVAQTAATGAIGNPADPLTFGTYSDHTSALTTYIGHLDDLFVANRAWTAGEVAEDFALSQQGYPGVLNRIVPATIFLAPLLAGTGGIYYRSLAGGGSL